MATLKQQKYLRRLKGQVGLKRYQKTKRILGYRQSAEKLSKAEASRLISTLLGDIAQEKKDTFNFAMRLHSLQLKDTNFRQ